MVYKCKNSLGAHKNENSTVLTPCSMKCAPHIVDLRPVSTVSLEKQGR